MWAIGTVAEKRAMTDAQVAKLVLMWARERGVVDLPIFCASIRSWGIDLPLIATTTARDLALGFPWSAEDIFQAFAVD